MRHRGSAFRRAADRRLADPWRIVAVLALVLGFVGGAAGRAGAVVAPPDDGAAEPDGVIAGVVVDHQGRPRLGVVVQLHAAGDDGAPIRHLGPAYTGSDGAYRMEDLAAGCYAVVVEAPAGATFADGAATDEHRRCLEPAQVIDDLRSVTAAPPSAAADGSPPPPQDPSTVAVDSIDIFHVGHHLGRLDPVTVRLPMAGLEVEVEAGGWARLVTALRAGRLRPGLESTVTVHTGGVLGGSALSTVFGGAPDAALMNRVCFDVLAPDDDDLGRPNLEAFLAFLADGPCGTEVLLPDDGPTTLRTIGSREVAFVTVSDGPGPLADRAAATERRVEGLAAGGADTIVLLSGLGPAADRALARRLPAIDAIIGWAPDDFVGDLDALWSAITPAGGSDDPTGPGRPDGDDATDPADRLPATGDDGTPPTGPVGTMVERNADGDPVCLGWAGGRALTLGHVRLQLDDAGVVTGCDARAELLLGRELTVIDADTGERRSPTPEERRAANRAIADHPWRSVVVPDEAASRALAEWAEALDTLIDEVVGRVDERLCRSSVPGRRVGVLCGSDGEVRDIAGPRVDAQRLVSEAVRHHGRLRAAPGGPVLAIVGSGAADRVVEPGLLALADVYRIVPDDRTLTHLVLTGEEVARALEDGITAAVDGPAAATADTSRPDPDAFPHTAGLRWTPDYGAPAGGRVGPIEVLSGDDRTWQPLDPGAEYAVVTTDDLVTGDRAYPTLRAAARDGRATPTTIGATEAVLTYIEEVLGGVVQPPDPLTTDRGPAPAPPDR
jgi:5'-nucleotidase